MKESRQTLRPDDLQDVLDSAKNAARKGTQQFLTPPSLAAALALPLPRFRATAADFTCGTGELLRGLDARTCLGVDIDSRAANAAASMPHSGHTQAWQTATADFTQLYDLLAESDCRFDLTALNPPFDLDWETERFAALAKSQCEAVRIAFKACGRTIKSWLATFLVALDRCTARGEGYLLCNEATAIRALGDPGDTARIAPDGTRTNAGPARALRRHIWLWLSLPEGTFDAAFTPCVLYFARDHERLHSTSEDCGGIFRLVSPSPDPSQLLAPMFAQRSMLRYGTCLHSDYDFDTGTVSKWRACLAELRVRNGGKASHPFNLWIENAKIHRHLTPFQGYSGRIPKKDAEALNALHGQSPFALVMQKATRLAMLRAVKGSIWKVDPALLAAVDTAMATYHAARAPLYEPNKLQRIGWLDEEDAIVCEADLTVKPYVSGKNQNAAWHETNDRKRMIQRILNQKEKGIPEADEWEAFTNWKRPVNGKVDWIHNDTFDSEDEALAWLLSGAQQETAPSFIAGRSYAIHTATRIIERKHRRTNAVTGKKEDCSLHGQELVIRVFDAKNRAHEFGDFSDEERAKAGATILHPIEALADHFTIPPVADVSTLHAGKYQRIIGILDWLDGVPFRNSELGILNTELAASQIQNPTSNIQNFPKNGAAHPPPDAPPIFSSTHPKVAALLAQVQATMRNTGFTFRGTYQKDDIARTSVHAGAIAGWEPGLGKTIPLLLTGLVNGALRHLLVVPESLHDQVCKEALDKFGLHIRRLNSQRDFHADPLLQEAALDILRGRRSEVCGIWITSYSQLGYNGGDEWCGKENDDGDIIVSKKCQREREEWHSGSSAEGKWKEEYDKNIGITDHNAKGHGIRCLSRPTLATLLMHLFREDSYVGCDEAVRLKADDSYTSLGVRRLSPQFRCVLTGTPIKNHLDDIFWLLWWAAGGNPEPTARFPYAGTNADKEKFAREFMLMEQNHTREKAADDAGKKRPPRKRVPILCNIHRLWKLLGPLVIRRRKDDLPGTDIVPKTVVPIRIRPGSAQLAVYAHHLLNRPQFTKAGQPMNPISAILAQLTALRIAALCPDSNLLRIRRVKLHKVTEILKPKNKDGRSATTDDTDGTDKNGSGSSPIRDIREIRGQNIRAIKVAKLADRTPFEGEREVAFSLLEQMLQGDIALDIEELCQAAPSLAERIRAAVVIETEPPSARSWTDHNPKQAAILAKIAELIALGEQVVVMSPFQDFSRSLQRRLEEAGVASVLLDGDIAPAKRGRMALDFKRRKYAVLIGGIESMGEGHSFENCSHLILPSVGWALDKNLQAIDRVHRLNSPKPVTIYLMVTENTVDERLEALFHEKGDAASLALDGRIRPDDTGEVNLAQLLADAVRNFDATAPSIPEKDIEAEWEKSLRSRLGLAMRRYREWHPPIDATAPCTPTEIRTAVAMLNAPAKGEPAPIQNSESKIQNSKHLLKGVPDNTLRFLLSYPAEASVTAERESFERYAAERPGEWRKLWAPWAKQYRAPKPASIPSKPPSIPSTKPLSYLEQLRARTK